MDVYGSSQYILFGQDWLIYNKTGYVHWYKNIIIYNMNIQEDLFNYIKNNIYTSIMEWICIDAKGKDNRIRLSKTKVWPMEVLTKTTKMKGNTIHNMVTLFGRLFSIHKKWKLPLLFCWLIGLSERRRQKCYC